MLANDVIFICATHVGPIPDVKDTAGDWQHGWVGIRLGSFSLWRCGRLDCRVIYHTNNSFTNRLNISVHELTGWLFVWLTDWLNDDLVVWLTAMFGGLLCARFIFLLRREYGLSDFSDWSGLTLNSDAGCSPFSRSNIPLTLDQVWVVWAVLWAFYIL